MIALSNVRKSSRACKNAVEFTLVVPGVWVVHLKSKQ